MSTTRRDHSRTEACTRVRSRSRDTRNSEIRVAASTPMNTATNSCPKRERGQRDRSPAAVAARRIQAVSTPTPMTYPSPYTVLMICDARASSPSSWRSRLTRTSMLRSCGSASRPRSRVASCERDSTRLGEPSKTVSSRYSAPLEGHRASLGIGQGTGSRVQLPAAEAEQCAPRPHPDPGAHGPRAATPP